MGASDAFEAERARASKLEVESNQLLEFRPKVSHVVLSESRRAEGGNSRPRRALVLADEGVAEGLERLLVEADYETRALTAKSFDASEIAAFAPDVVLFEMRGGEHERVTLAHRLRAEASTYALPVVFLFHTDERMLRNAALSIGVDDYFALETPPAEMRARLDALYWRAEVGRRAAPVVGEQHAEIDNFLLLLDTVRADIEDGAEGTLAIVVAGDGSAHAAQHAAERERRLAEAHGFLKLNLRRIDSVVFYGPTMLLVYLPGMSGVTARIALMRARERFQATRPETRIHIGLASFPADGDDVEQLFERAEASVHKPPAPAAATPDVEADAHIEADMHEADMHAATSPRIEAETQVAATPDDDTQVAVTYDDTHDNAHAAQVSETPAQLVDAEAMRRVADDATSRVFAGATSSVAEDATPKVAGDSTLKDDSTQKIADDSTRKVAVDETQRVAEDATPSTARTEEAQGYARTTGRASAHVVRESRTVETGALPVLIETGTNADGDRLARAAAEAGARERERRARGEVMPRRLLLAVSDPVRMAQVNLLIRAAGYEVRAAFDGQQALNLLRIERPDLLLLDYELQGIDGMETLRRLRKQNGGRLKLPVVLLLPAARRENTGREALDEGARATVALPYDPVELLDTIRTAGAGE